MTCSLCLILSFFLLSSVCVLSDSFPCSHQPFFSHFPKVRGDKVEVIGHHPEKGKQGIVLEVNRKADRVRVEGVNLGVHCIKGDKERGQKGMQVMRERSIHYSNVNLVDPITNKPTRITKKYLEDGTKVRVAKKSGAIIPRPDIVDTQKTN